MVKENAAYAAPLVSSVGIDEIVVTPSLESWIELGMVASARRPERSVKVDRVFGIGVCGREIGSSPEPGVPGFAGWTGDLEVSDVEVHCGHHGTAGVCHQAQPGDEEAGGVEHRMGANALRQLRPQASLNGRPVNPHLFEGGAVAQHPADSTASTRPLPAIFPKLLALIQLPEELGYLIVQVFDARNDAGPERLGH
jgi:hypothetical protein